MRIFEQATLQSTPDKLLLTPPSSQSHRGYLCINRNDGRVTFDDNPPPLNPATVGKRRTVHGVVGMLDSPSGGQKLLVVITRCVRVGEVTGHVVYRAETFEVVNVMARPEEDEAADETTTLLRSMLVNVLTEPYFYFSYTTDLSRTQQKLFEGEENDDAAGKDKELIPMIARADARFVWNTRLLSEFVAVGQDKPGLHRFVVPLVHGAMFINKCSVNGKGFTWSVLSRRSRCYVGARLFTRGCDDKGHAANFVETEQIVESESAGAGGKGGGSSMVASFVQTRGSIPLIWQQKPDLRYKPPPRMIEKADSTSAFMAHFKEQILLYGKQVMINLVDQKGAEGELAVNYRSTVEEARLGELRYVAYDFHKEVKNMRYDKLDQLIDSVRDSVRDHEYFFRDPSSSSSLKTQKGVCRTNCIDSLDRTNVVQSLLARENLKVVLVRIGVLKPNEDPFRNSSVFLSIFRTTWADNADLLSIQYAGTGALKTDFTRTGKRSRFGLLQDGWNASNRYYLNNFMDGDRTDALKVFVGEFSPEQFIRSYFSSRRGPKGPLAYLPTLLLVFLLILVCSLIFPKEAGVRFVAFVAIFSGMVALTAKMMVQNGKEFVNWPATLKRN